jgi:DNA helicase HerA-like ATPase
MGIVVSTTSTGRVVVVTTAVFSTGVTPAPDLVVVVVVGSFVVVVSASNAMTGIGKLAPRKFDPLGDAFETIDNATDDHLEKNSVGIPA